jgi:hypothetical protein
MMPYKSAMTSKKYPLHAIPPIKKGVRKLTPI